MKKPMAWHVSLAAITLAMVGFAAYRSSAVRGFAQSAPAAAPASASTIAPMHFHHVHLNSLNPKAAADYYLRPYPATTQRLTFNGYEAVKTGNIYLLFSKVTDPPKTERTAPQSSLWHFGWNDPDSQKYDHEFRTKGLTIMQMWDAADGKLVDMSSDTLPGPPTQEQILEMRAHGVQPTHKGGFGYLRGPDGAMVENAQGPPGTPERFNHVHMFHEHPLCAIQWYIAHLGARVTSAVAATLPGPGGDCKQRYSAPTWPSFYKFPGFVREPSGSVKFDDIDILIRPWPGGGLASPRGYVADHWALSVADLPATVARLHSENVKFLEEMHPWGNSRAVMIEGPDRAAIEIVEEK